MNSPPFLFYNAGCSVIPIRLNGSKAPSLKEWRQYQRRQPSLDELTSWFPNPDEFGFGVICGTVSHGLEVIDFDVSSNQKIYFDWYRAIESIAVYLPVIETPNDGFHAYYRCSKISGNSKIAKDETGKTLIETRGEGGYVVGPGSSAKCHQLDRRYIQSSGPVLPDFIPLISPEQRRELWDAARRFDLSGESKRLGKLQARKLESRFRPNDPKTEIRPDEDFNRRGSFPEYLRKCGWKSTNNVHWTRPGKTCGVSATLRQSKAGYPVLVNFSSNAEIGINSGHKTVSLFDFYTHVEHGGDYRESALALRQEGFGT